MPKTLPVHIEMTLYGKPVVLDFSVSADKVTPLGILSALHHIDNRFVETAVEVFVDQQQTISCKAGCGACCRQVVPLAEFEAYHVARLIERLPEPRQARIKQRFAEGCAKLDGIGWLSDLQQHLERDASHQWVESHALTYFRQGIACPFLEDESCSIHSDRPLACREYLVTSPADYCKEPARDTVKHIELKFQLSKIVRKLWDTRVTETSSPVPLIYALQWVRAHPNRLPRKRGIDWIKALFDHLGRNPGAE